jgi:hypothetical protein
MSKALVPVAVCCACAASAEAVDCVVWQDDAGALVKVGDEDSNINPYPSAEEDETLPRAGKVRSEWRINDRMDVKDDGVWYAATIKAINHERNMVSQSSPPPPPPVPCCRPTVSRQVFVGFDGYHRQFDCWVERESLRLAPLHKFSETSKGPPLCARAEPEPEPRWRAERAKRLAYLQQQGGAWGGDADQVKMESFFNVVRPLGAASRRRKVRARLVALAGQEEQGHGSLESAAGASAHGREGPHR